MKALNSLIEYKFVKDNCSNLTNEKIDIYLNLIKKYIDKEELSLSSKKSRCITLYDIVQNNIDNIENLYLEYLSSNSTYRKLNIRYGKNAETLYNEKLKNRIPNKVTVYTKEYWIKCGLSEDQAKEKVSEIQKKNSSKRTKSSYSNFSLKCKNSVDYWTNIGYSKEEAEYLRTPYLTKNDLSSMVERYGEEEGYKKWISRCNKYKESMMNNLHNRKTAGYVSKESLKFFIPLYRYARKLGIPKEKIYLGISGSREYFIRDESLLKNGGKFYDFTISCINLIIEYNGTFWHAREIENWKNPWTDYQSSINDDLYKKTLAESKFMSYHVVWSDEDLLSKLNFFKELIKEKWENGNAKK
jgi:hypothetical protein